MMIKNLKSIIEEAKKGGRKTFVVAGAEEKTILDAVQTAQAMGLLDPVLIGNRDRIEILAKASGIDLSGITVKDCRSDDEIASSAAEMVHSGRADVLMKGKVDSPTLLKAVLDKKFGFRTDHLLSHIALLEIPNYQKLLLITDGGMIIHPTLEQKIGILKNALGLIRKLGIDRPKAAILAAFEKVNPEMPETEDAVQLTELTKKGVFGDAYVEGPMALDIAASPESARIKGVKSVVSGDPDIFLVPNIACGNILAKGLVYFAGAQIAGLIIGANKPIVLLSRADSVQTRINSIALANFIS
jgi:phosphate butyryltransferase